MFLFLLSFWIIFMKNLGTPKNFRKVYIVLEPTVYTSDVNLGIPKLLCY